MSKMFLVVPGTELIGSEYHAVASIEVVSFLVGREVEEVLDSADVRESLELIDGVPHLSVSSLLERLEEVIDDERYLRRVVEFLESVEAEADRVNSADRPFLAAARYNAQPEERLLSRLFGSERSVAVS